MPVAHPALHRSRLYAIATGFQALSPEPFADDHALLAAETAMYEALYRYCEMRVSR